MKSKLKISTVIFLFSLGMAPAQPTAPAPLVDPTTGLPMRNYGRTSQPQNAPVAVDPTTGLPLPAAPAVPQPDWKDPEWKDPDIVLKDVYWRGVPLEEVAHFIRENFNGQFDIILPTGTSEGINRLTGEPVPPTDWSGQQVELQIKNVTASELFNTMNLIFENDKTPLQWELKVNGHRQLALLRVLLDPMPQALAQPAALQPQRRIYFVGDLIGDEKSGGLTMDQIIKTITDVWKMTDTANGKIQFHNEAQLLVVTGTPGQIDFVEQTLSALHEKVALARRSLSKSAELKTKADESKKQ